PKVRDLFNYRFDNGSLKGHAFGNLFLTALEKMTGDFAEGIELASEILNITGLVEPITLSNVKLAMRDQKDEIIHGEFEIAHIDFQGHRPGLWLEPKAIANPRALRAIKEADMVIVAPGNLYGSLAPALIVPGVGAALADSKAIKVYVCNLVTKPGQTDGFKVHDYAAEIERLAGESFLGAVIYNTEKPSSNLLTKYAKEGELSVEYDEDMLRDAHYVAIGADLLSGEIWQNVNKSDPIAAARSLIRHDSKAIARVIMEFYDNIQQSSNRS
ncbi:MAG: hypothetical protein JWO61_36, partial [Candidatus Saccharibacteria bacterium]|nr:hypothetical protein [Candidatus Saccharibacteria bacterium]